MCSGFIGEKLKDLFENINPKCNILNVFTVIFDQCNVFLMSKGINFLQKTSDPKLLNNMFCFTGICMPSYLLQ